jgi:hypothetical protein
MAETNLGEAVDGILDRLVVLEPIALPATRDAVKYFFHSQSTWPYWVHRLEGLTPGATQHDDRVSRFELRLLLRLVYGHLTADWQGGIEQGAVVDAADIVAFFVRNKRLAIEESTDVTLRKAPRWLHPDGVTITAGALGVYPLSDSLHHIGVEFRLTVPITVSLEL